VEGLKGGACSARRCKSLRLCAAPRPAKPRPDPPPPRLPASYLVALGSGGIKPCVSSFGGDQVGGSEVVSTRHRPAMGPQCGPGRNGPAARPPLAWPRPRDTSAIPSAPPPPNHRPPQTTLPPTQFRENSARERGWRSSFFNWRAALGGGRAQGRGGERSDGGPAGRRAEFVGGRRVEAEAGCRHERHPRRPVLPPDRRHACALKPCAPHTHKVLLRHQHRLPGGRPGHRAHPGEPRVGAPTAPPLSCLRARGRQRAGPGRPPACHAAAFAHACPPPLSPSSTHTPARARTLNPRLPPPCSYALGFGIPTVAMGVSILVFIGGALIKL
jgi:hypothetical protein